MSFIGKSSLRSIFLQCFGITRSRSLSRTHTDTGLVLCPINDLNHYDLLDDLIDGLLINCNLDPYLFSPLYPVTNLCFDCLVLPFMYNFLQNFDFLYGLVYFSHGFLGDRVYHLGNFGLFDFDNFPHSCKVTFHFITKRDMGRIQIFCKI